MLALNTSAFSGRKKFIIRRKLEMAATPRKTLALSSICFCLDIKVVCTFFILISAEYKQKHATMVKKLVLEYL